MNKTARVCMYELNTYYAFEEIYDRVDVFTDAFSGNLTPPC